MGKHLANSIEEIKALGIAGWNKFDEMTYNRAKIHFYRNPKRFKNLRG
jgi:hypothetical protein